MSDADKTARSETLAKLAQSREELRHLLDPPRRESGGGTRASSGAGVESEESSEHFPRSRTMKMLLSGRGLGAVGAVVGGILLARPAFALRLLRMVPASALARMVLLRTVNAIRTRHSPGR
jgi:hypothetical protein